MILLTFVHAVPFCWVQVARHLDLIGHSEYTWFTGHIFGPVRNNIKFIFFVLWYWMNCIIFQLISHIAISRHIRFCRSARSPLCKYKLGYRNPSDKLMKFNKYRVQSFCVNWVKYYLLWCKEYRLVVCKLHGIWISSGNRSTLDSLDMFSDLYETNISSLYVHWFFK